MKNSHPYQEYERLPVWKVLEDGVKELCANGDMEETTARRYIVGYLSKRLVDSHLVATPHDNGKPRPPSAKTIFKIARLKPFRKRMRSRLY